MKEKIDKESLDEIEDFLDIVEDDEFSIGQSYEDHPAKKIRCKTCMGEKFLVGVGSYFTAVKCAECLWELCIHDG